MYIYVRMYAYMYVVCIHIKTLCFFLGSKTLVPNFRDIQNKPKHVTAQSTILSKWYTSQGTTFH